MLAGRRANQKHRSHASDTDEGRLQFPCRKSIRDGRSTDVLCVERECQRNPHIIAESGKAWNMQLASKLLLAYLGRLESGSSAKLFSFAE